MYNEDMTYENIRFWEPVDYAERDILSCFGCIPDRLDEYLLSPFQTFMRRKLGHTTYLVETSCGGTEPLTDKLHRMIFTSEEASA